jgi:hypothetical protein
MKALMTSLAMLLFAPTPGGFAQIQPSSPVVPAPRPDRAWIARSDAYTQLLLDVQLRHSPEGASYEGLSQFDKEISILTREDEDLARKETETALAKIEAAAASEKDPRVEQDLQILIQSVKLQFRSEDYARAHQVPFINAPELVFSGLQGLLDDQTAPERRAAAVVRLKKYAGLEPGFTPSTELAKRYITTQMAVPDAVYPSKIRMETELAQQQLH